MWTKALEIPRGEVRPYGWIAAEIGRPKAVRAVGTALGHNPVPLIVPCHRVVRTDGTIGQYSLGGPGNKRTILSAEGLDPTRDGGGRPGRRTPVRLDDDADRVLADLPPRAARAGPLPGLVPVARRGPGQGLPAVQDLPPGRGRGRRLRSASTRRIWPSGLAQRGSERLHSPPSVSGEPSLRDATVSQPDRRLGRIDRALPRVGLDVPRHQGRRRDRPAVRDGLHPVRPGRDPARRRGRPAQPANHPAAEPPGPRRHPDRRRAAADGRHGPGRMGRADDPQRNRRAPDRPHADVARDLRPRVPGRAAAAGGRDRDRHRRGGGRDPRLADRGGRRPRPGRPARAARLPGLLGAGRDLRRRGGPSCRRPRCSRAASR